MKKCKHSTFRVLLGFFVAALLLLPYCFEKKENGNWSIRAVLYTLICSKEHDDEGSVTSRSYTVSFFGIIRRQIEAVKNLIACR